MRRTIPIIALLAALLLQGCATPNCMNERLFKD